MTSDVGRIPGHRYFRGGNKNEKERRDGVLALLEDYGVIRAMTMASKRGPVIKYAVNPALVEVDAGLSEEPYFRGGTEDF